MYHQGKLNGIQPNVKMLIDSESVDRILDRPQRKRDRAESLRQTVQPIRRPKR